MAPQYCKLELHLCSKLRLIPPHTGPVPYDASFDLAPRKTKEAADRALNFYLNPGATKTQIPPREMVNDLVDLTDGPRRYTMLVLQRVIMLSALAVNRVLDNHKPG